MARGDFKIHWPQADEPFNIRRIVGSGVVKSINAGEPTKEGSAGAVAICVDGDGTTSQKFAGIAKDDSTDTVAVAGQVDVFLPFPGLIYEGKAKVATNANTQAKIDALMGKRVVFDLTSTSWTVDSAAANAATNGLVILGGDYKTSTLFFAISQQITSFDNPTTA